MIGHEYQDSLFQIPVAFHLLKHVQSWFVGHPDAVERVMAPIAEPDEREQIVIGKRTVSIEEIEKPFLHSRSNEKTVKTTFLSACR